MLAAIAEPQPWYGHPAEPSLVTIGDVGVGATTVVDTQRLGAGRADDVPVRRPVPRARENIPTWAIVSRRAFVFCFLGLLFLLAEVADRRGSA